MVKLKPYSISRAGFWCWGKKVACGLQQQNHSSNSNSADTLLLLSFRFFWWQTKLHSPSLRGLQFTRLWSAWARTTEASTATRPLAASWFASRTNSTAPKSFAPETLRFSFSFSVSRFSFFRLGAEKLWFGEGLLVDEKMSFFFIGFDCRKNMMFFGIWFLRKCFFFCLVNEKKSFFFLSRGVLELEAKSLSVSKWDELNVFLSLINTYILPLFHDKFMLFVEPY